MKYLKLALISILTLVLVVTAISLFIPSEVKISKAINIGAGPETILGQIDDIEKWKNWYPGYETISGQPVDTLDGRVMSMKANGSAVIITKRTPVQVTAEVKREGKNAIVMGWSVIEHPDADSTSLQWFMDFDLKWYPWEKFSSLLFEDMYGIQMEEGLTRIKQILESDRSSND